MLSAQQTRSGVPTEQQSVLPTVRGVPWWGAVLIALVPTVLGAAIDGSGTDGLATTYRILYFVGCVTAVLAVRRRSLFTAMTQPPLIAFGVALVTLYLVTPDSGSGLKELVLDVALPIAKTFPLMAWTFAAVLALGLGRWFLTRRPAEVTPRRSNREHANRERSTSARRSRSDRSRSGESRTDGPRGERSRSESTRSGRQRTTSGGARGLRDAAIESGADRTRRRDDTARHPTARDPGTRSARRAPDDPTRITPPARRTADRPVTDREFQTRETAAREPHRTPPRDEPGREARTRAGGYRWSDDPPAATPSRDQPSVRARPERPRAEAAFDDLRPTSAPRARYRGVNP